MHIIHHLTMTTTPRPNNPAGQLHLCVNTRLGSDSPHMATNNLRKYLEHSSKLCSSQFGQMFYAIILLWRRRRTYKVLYVS